MKFYLLTDMKLTDIIHFQASLLIYAPNVLLTYDFVNINLISYFLRQLEASTQKICRLFY